jgi:hypothetical protein
MIWMKGKKCLTLGYEMYLCVKYYLEFGVSAAAFAQNPALINMISPLIVIYLTVTVLTYQTV